MTHIPRRSSLVQATAIGAVAVGLGLLACDTPAPNAADGLTGPAADVVGVDADHEFGPEGTLHTREAYNTWTEGDETLDLIFGDVYESAVHLRIEDNEWVGDPDASTISRLKERKELEAGLDKPEWTEQGARVEFTPEVDGSFLPRVKREPSADESPALLVLDGEIWEGSRDELKRLLSERQAGDVERLSGPEAVARFGPRGVNGAILLKTDGD